jgi:hypothetical protein
MSTEKELDDQSLFDEAVADDVAETTETGQQDTPADPPADDKHRDDAGRFAKGEPESKGDKSNPDSRIPEWRREEIAAEKNRAVDDAKAARDEAARERAAREELQRRLDALQPKKDPNQDDGPDPLLDPAAFRKSVKEEIRQEMLAERREESLQRAHKAYGKEFEDAYSAAQQRLDPALKAKMQASRDPGETLVQWHREQKTMQEVGSDPNAWLEKKLEERLKDPAFLAKAVELARGSAQPSSQQQNGRPLVDLPRSLSGVSRSNAAVKADLEDKSDRELFEEIAG